MRFKNHKAVNTRNATNLSNLAELINSKTTEDALN